MRRDWRGSEVVRFLYVCSLGTLETFTLAKQADAPGIDADAEQGKGVAVIECAVSPRARSAVLPSADVEQRPAW
nr:hypothetical protein CFP56_62110 [Quercus suber]